MPSSLCTAQRRRAKLDCILLLDPFALPALSILVQRQPHGESLERARVGLIKQTHGEWVPGERCSRTGDCGKGRAVLCRTESVVAGDQILEEPHSVECSGQLLEMASVIRQF
jgi:hypothetical protein